MRLAAVIKGTAIEDLVGLARYLETQIKKLGVKITSNKEADLALIEGLKPDVVVLAMGGIPITPKIPGIDKPIVKHPAQMYRTLKKFMRLFNPSILKWLMKVWMPIGSRVVVLGGGIEGCELTEFLTKQGRKVILLETSNELGAKLVKETKERLLMWFAKKGVAILTGVKYEEITDEGITIITNDGEKKHIEADNILPALGLEPNRELFIALKDKVPEVYLIGDCEEPRLILDAIDDGSQIGRMI
jgi:pyruvate/2-oxoglutarate dehydrogenase complex dihydrolipoamide dehydrogenase (E3) component